MNSAVRSGTAGVTGTSESPRCGQSQLESPGSVVVPILTYLVLLCILPARLVLPGLGGAGRPASLFAVGLLVWWVLDLFIPKTTPQPRVGLRAAILLYFTAFLASMAAGLDRGLPGIELRAMDREFLVLLGFVGVMIVVIDGVKTTADVERILDWMVALVAVGSLVGIIQFVGGPDLSQMIRFPGLVNHSELLGFGARGTPNFPRVRGVATHPIEYSVILGAVLPVAITRAQRGAGHRRLRFLAAAIVAGGVPLAVSRSGIVALVVGLSVLAVRWTWRERVNGAALALMGALIYQAITPGLLGTIRGLFSGASTDDSVTGRTEDFAATAPYIAERPWFGRGPGTFIPDRYILLDNEYLGTVVDSGYVGLAALLALLLTAGVTAIRLCRPGRDAIVQDTATALGAGVAVGVAVLATFDALAFPMYAGILMLQIGCLGALASLDNAVQGPPASSSFTSERGHTFLAASASRSTGDESHIGR